MKVVDINFLEFLAGEEQNILTTLVNLRQDFDVFSQLDSLYREPVGLMDVPVGEELVASLYLFVHFHLYFSAACLGRSHLSECLASTRKAIDASLSAYEMVLDPTSQPLYKNRDNRFQFIKAHISKARKNDPSHYPLAAELLKLHDICSEFGSHPDVSSFIHRVEMKNTGQTGKSILRFHYFQFPRDKYEYHAYFVGTLLAFHQMLVIFRDFITSKAIGLQEGWKEKIAQLGERKGDILLFLAKWFSLWQNRSMPRTARASVGGMCYHVINRGNARQEVFRKNGDYKAFIDLFDRACERVAMRVLGYCVMPNHFHLVLWSYSDGDLGKWMQWLLTAHVRRYHQHYRTSGHVWQGRFKAFPIEQDDHLLTVLRYIERNPLRAGLVEHAEDWPWSSLSRSKMDQVGRALHPPPVTTPADWIGWVNQPQTEAELEGLRHSVNRGTPYGSVNWVQYIAAQLGLEASLRPRGRPQKYRKK